MEPRITTRNCTMVLPLEIEVDLQRYWSGVFNSPVQSSWLRDGLNVSEWQVGLGSGGRLGGSGWGWGFWMGGWGGGTSELVV